MEFLDLIGDSVILRFDGVVVELFLKTFDKSLRIPAAWLGVQVKPGKHGAIRLEVGTSATAGPRYGPEVAVFGNYWPIDTTIDEEPIYRAYFEKVTDAASA